MPPSPAITLLRGRRGIALPLMLLVTISLTVTIGAGFMLASSEYQAGTDHDAQLQAYTMAQQGLERYLTDNTSLPGSFPNTQTIALSEGSAVVTLRQLRPPSSGVESLYLITSVGRATASRLRQAFGTPMGERIVSQFVIWQSSTLDADAAFTSLSGLNAKNGVSGTVSGVDACGTPSSDIAGLAVPDGTLDMNGNSTSFIDGNPDDVELEIGTPGPTGTAKDSVDIDWAGILAGSIAPDFVMDRTNGKKNGGWPSPAQFANWPVVLVKGDVTNGDNVDGYGVLIVTEDADLTNITWHGLVLVGGQVTLSGSATKVWGALLTGLNVKLGIDVDESVVGNGNMHVQYHSCDLAQALLKFGGWRRIQNSWSDNWPHT